jgi:hypothetical protein
MTLLRCTSRGFRHLRLMGRSFFSEAESKQPNSEAMSTPTATKMTYIATGTRSFSVPALFR